MLQKLCSLGIFNLKKIAWRCSAPSYGRLIPYHKHKYTVFVLKERRRYNGVTMISYKLRIRRSNEDNAKSKIHMIQAAVQQSKFEERISNNSKVELFYRTERMPFGSIVCIREEVTGKRNNDYARQLVWDQQV